MQLRPAVSAFRFDAAQFERLRADFCAGSLDPTSARLSRAPEPLDEAALQTLGPDPRHLRERGLEVLRAGQVASLVLNGGMATRFGGGAKGCVPVLAGSDHTFLSLKLGALARHPDLGPNDPPIPVAIMSSFATEGSTLAHLDDVNWAGVPADARHTFTQALLPRITLDGQPLVDAAGAEALEDTQVYAVPGHGDTLHRVRDSGTLTRLRARGVRHILVSNVDNLGASVDPVVVGAHLAAVDRGAAMTVEVVRREPDDRGGCVARVDGRPVIVEGFRLPEGVNIDRYPHFNTNTLWFTIDALDRPFDLDWFPVQRSLRGPDGSEHAYVQFEQLIGQATEHVPTAFVEVDRVERFVPIKTRADLRAQAEFMRTRIESL